MKQILRRLSGIIMVLMMALVFVSAETSVYADSLLFRSNYSELHKWGGMFLTLVIGVVLLVKAKKKK